MRDSSFHDFVIDLLHDVPVLTSRAMFGGYGLYAEKKIFAIIVDSELYLKGGEHAKSFFKSEDSHPFSYEKGRGKKVEMNYWYVPENVLEDREILADWVGHALADQK